MEAHVSLMKMNETGMDGFLFFAVLIGLVLCAVLLIGLFLFYAEFDDSKKSRRG